MRSSIPFSAVAEFIEQLGVELGDLAAVEVLPQRVVVTEYRRDEDGNRFSVGDDAAKVHTEIRIERSA